MRRTTSQTDQLEGSREVIDRELARLSGKAKQDANAKDGLGTSPADRDPDHKTSRRQGSDR